MWERLLTQLRVVASYIFLLLLPLPCFLSLEHDVPLSTSLFNPISTVASLLLLLSLLGYAWYVRKRWPLLSFGLVWFFLNLIIESTIVPLELKFEHRMYLPSAGFYLALFFLLLRGCRKFTFNMKAQRRLLLVSGAVIVFSLLTMMTYYRNAAWCDKITLYADCVAKAPLTPRSHANLAKALAEKGNYLEAVRESEKAIALGRSGLEEYWAAANNIVICTDKVSGPEEAIQRGQVLLLNAPPKAKQNSYPLFLNNLGRLALQEGKYKEAYKYFLKTFWMPLQGPFLKDLKECEWLLEKTIRAAIQNGIVLFDGFEEGKQHPDEAVYKNMAILSYSTHHWKMALQYCQQLKAVKACSQKYQKIENEIKNRQRLNSAQKDKGTLKSNYLYQPFKSYGSFCLAVSYYLIKSGLINNFIVDHLLDGAKKQKGVYKRDAFLLNSWRLYVNKNFNGALNEIDHALKLDPEYARLWFNKGIYYLGEGKPLEARQAFSRGLKLYPDYPHKNKILTMLNGSIQVEGQKGG
jgi:tetratricopeptide (TPR) repeat protein